MRALVEVKKVRDRYGLFVGGLLILMEGDLLRDGVLINAFREVSETATAEHLFLIKKKFEEGL
jgi:hypothetical protein